MILLSVLCVSLPIYCFSLLVFEDYVLRRRVNNVTVAEGGHLTLPCNHFRSIPAASVAWYSANHSLEKAKPVVVPLGRRVSMDYNGNH